MRLTNDIRRSICKDAIKAAFDGRNEEINKQEAALAIKVYEQVIPQEEREAIDRIHECWFGTSSSLYLNVASSHVTLSSDRYFRVPEKEYGKNNWSRIFATIKAGPLADEIMTFCNAKEDLNKEQTTAERAIDALLSSATTLKALMAAWPEGEPYWSKYLDQPEKPGLPALQVSEVNRMLGLPKPEAKAA